MIQTYAHFILRFRWLIIVSSLLLVSIAGYGIKNLHFKSDYRMFFSEENPQLIAYESLQKTYTKDDNVLLVLTPADNNIFSPQNLAIAEKLTHDLWQTPYSTRVDSITNFQHSYAIGDDLIVEDLVKNAEQLSSEKISQIKDYALNEPLLVNRLVSPDARVMGFNVVIQRPGFHQDSETREVTHFIRQQVKQLKSAHPEMDIHITGSVMMDTAFAESSELDMKTLTPAMLTVIIIVLGLLVKSVWGVLAATIMITLSIVAAVGLAGWMNIAFSPSSIPAPTILLTLAVANTVHILTSYYHSLAHGIEKIQSMSDSLKGNFKAIFFTNFSTGIGFLSMNFSESPPFRDLGNITAMGVGVTFILAISFLPALVTLLPEPKNKLSLKSNPIWKNLANNIIKHGRTYFALSTVLVVALIACIPLNTLDDEYVKYFDESVQFRQDTDYTTEHLTGIYRIDYSLKTMTDSGINNPEYLRKVDAFVEWYRQQPETIHVFAITDILKRLNQNMHGGDPSWYRLPETAEMAAQYLLVFEMSLPYGLDLNDRIDVGKSATRVTASLHSISSQQVIDLEKRAQEWLKTFAPELSHSEGTGTTLLFAHIGQRNIVSMIGGVLLAIGLISILMMFVLRSAIIGSLSLIPNLIPAGMAFGMWALLVGQVGMASSVVIAMTLGILVDDTVHFLSRYQHARKHMQLSPDDAIRYTFTTVGKALWVTSVVLILGFLVLALSSFKINQEMGMLTAIIFALGLLADFLLLPPILLFIEKLKTCSKNKKILHMQNATLPK
ncbi:hypothetical protein SAMN05421690_100128 [Nitrosomonas sp. Nm51]|uniref:efflux RND transporter permease subunit n=1 Tax=Nitrosomonas sp. Nm51 TaxID=133720 RepID=UPI0008AC9177|nr:MMPL family transporter [Nitrosomonas sp. Nm51]SEQ75033.1 hypothetical protein SAMN05421690_100128 [Nitrosomonas sp. Nm51]